MIDKQPAADVEPVKHGKWVNKEVDWVCSICGTDALTAVESYRQVRSKFCPNCGAMMDLEE